MKKLLNLFPFLFAPFCGMAQSGNFTITGHIGNLGAPSKVYLNYMTNGQDHSDSATLVNGVFLLSGTVNPYSSARLALDHHGAGKDAATHGADVIYFYFGAENFQIDSKDSLTNAVITGSKTYNEYQEYAKAVGPMPWDIDKISNAEIVANPDLATDTAFINQVARHHYKMIADFQSKNLQFAKDRPDSYFAPVALFGTASNPKKVTIAEQVLDMMNPQVQATDAGKAIKEFISAHYRLNVGAAVPEFVQSDVNGKQVSLASFKGKIVLIDFWASWCGPCRKEIPNIVTQYKLYRDKGFEIVSVSLDNSRNQWEQAIKQEAMPWPQLSDLKGQSNAAARLYGVSAIPATFLIDKDGKLISVGLRGDDLNKKLAELFKN